MNFEEIAQMNNAQNGSGVLTLSALDAVVDTIQQQASRRLHGTTVQENGKTTIVFDPLPDEPFSEVDVTLLTEEQQAYVKARYEAYIAEHGYIIDGNEWAFLVSPERITSLMRLATRMEARQRRWQRWNKIHKRQRRAAQRRHYRGKHDRTI